MTLPFRRRHNDDEETHDRARSLSSRALLEDLDAEERAWLERHHAACTECRMEHEGFVADRELLHSLRDKQIEPPRDLWARTSAALDQAAAKRPLVTARSGTRVGPRGRTGLSPWRGFSLGAAVGAVALLVIVVSGLIPAQLPNVVPPTEGVAFGSPGPTPIDVTAQVGLLKPGADGSYEFVFTDIHGVCPTPHPECVPPPSSHVGSSVNLAGAKSSTVTISPGNDQLVFETESGPTGEGKIYVVPVTPTTTSTQPPATPSTSPAGGSAAPPSEAPGTPGLTPVPTPPGAIEIASGVTMIGEIAYSSDGEWLAFSAAPKDGSTGPDLYLYSVGSGTAVALTSDHQTYFSAWLGNMILASRIAPDATPAEPGASGANGNGNGIGNASGNGQGAAITGHPTSFLFDPVTSTSTDLARADVWLPVVDPSSRFVAYWSGTLRSTDGVSWQLADGQLVLDGWSGGAAVTPSSSTASGTPGSTTPGVGPAGHGTPIVTSHVEAFRTKFDPEGIRLAVWVGETLGQPVGRLHLVVIDPATATVKPDAPLEGVPALGRFSIDTNRLAWVSPPGQDGQESSLQVLGWDGEQFGAIQAEPAPDLLIIQ
jgi:hypothetical protein